MIVAQDQTPVQALGDKMREVFASVIPTGRPVALVDYPDFPNFGDHAIWLGTKRLLAGFGIEPAYECARGDYDPGALARRVGDRGVILLQGGGNFGDLYPLHQEFRHRVLADFPRHKIIGLPQSALFLRNEHLFDAVAATAKAGDVVLFARDVVSHHLMTRMFAPKIPVHLAPDMALLLGALPRVGTPITDILWLGRQDAEAGSGNNPAALASWQPAKLVRVAMPSGGDDLPMELAAVQGANGALLADWPGVSAGAPHVKAAIAQLDRDTRSTFFVRLGLAILSLGRVVVTDRLHGHILCLLLGIPHVLLNNNTGKTWNFFETWTRGAPNCFLARNAGEAWETAQAIVRTLATQPTARG